MAFYHGTSSAALPSIFRNGLVPGCSHGSIDLSIQRGGQLDPEIVAIAKRSVFVTEDRHYAETFAFYAAVSSRTEPRLLVVYRPRTQFQIDETLSPVGIALRYEGAIDPRYIAPADDLATEEQWADLRGFRTVAGAISFEKLGQRH